MLSFHGYYLSLFIKERRGDRVVDDLLRLVVGCVLNILVRYFFIHNKEGMVWL